MQDATIQLLIAVLDFSAAACGTALGTAVAMKLIERKRKKPKKKK